MGSDDRSRKTEDRTLRGAIYCSFCGLSQQEVARLVEGPRVWICDVCVDLAYGIVHRHYAEAMFDADWAAPWFDPNHPMNAVG